ncbi:hypothetical protein FYK55_10410 [Roseiconus nitratireducens]|uniref:Uncharacterized protein n=1 Tax=Roseiconus nitratireducens TaxID=2605748 RepID=A0A5M6DEK2_9BACT|nr:hypothetical protein [Roseiconus nitratireducens]KAA5543615.1 hypothetical protein FYK55_10410 [Roseiconus nitratireducens]
MTNPYAVTTATAGQPGFFGEHAELVRGTFLYRVVQVSHPVRLRFVYSGWWFRQTIELDGHTVWGQISWMAIRRQAEFRLPVELDPQQRSGRMEIEFSRGLRIRRFRIWIDQTLIYDEVA